MRDGEWVRGLLHGYEMWKARLLSIVVCCAACNAPSPAARSSLPWLQGFTAEASSDVEAADVSDRLSTIMGTDDEAGYGGLELRANVGSGNATRTVLASVHQGIAVLDDRGDVVARAPGIGPEGTADDLVALAAGEGQLDAPVIVLARTVGGHRESTTSLVVYQVGDHGRLDTLFDELVEERDGDHTVTGAVMLAPGALIYRAPHGETSLWQYDRARHRYVRKSALEPRPAPADVPARTPVSPV